MSCQHLSIRPVGGNHTCGRVPGCSTLSKHISIPLATGLYTAIAQLMDMGTHQLRQHRDPYPLRSMLCNVAPVRPQIGKRKKKRMMKCGHSNCEWEAASQCTRFRLCKDVGISWTGT